MRKRTLNIVGLLLGSVSLVALSCLSALDVWGQDRPRTARSVETEAPTSAGRAEGNTLSPAVQMQCAQKFGGVVYPPVYFHAGFDRDHLGPVITDLFQRLKKSGFRVIIGVSGHNVQGQIDMINTALEPVAADGTVAGIGLWEISLSRGPESGTDHAAKWETSDMQFFYPALVDLAELGTGPLAPKMKPPDGIGGLDPREHASAHVGAMNVDLAADAIGKKAKELLESLPKDQRSFRLKSVSPGHWWMI
ncbi:MAG: creatininase family protein [Planctomycetota bacterium]